MELGCKIHALVALRLRMSPPYPYNSKRGGPQSRSRRFGEKKTLLSLQRFEYRMVQPVTQALSWHHFKINLLKPSGNFT
jgi:hypothetical protein